MSDGAKPPALPGPGAPGEGAAAPGTTRPGGRRFAPKLERSYRPEGLTESGALAEIQRRRTRGEPSGADPLLQTRPSGPALPARPEGPAYSPLTQIMDEPLPMPSGAGVPAAPADIGATVHPLAPQPPLPGDPVFDLTVGGAPQRVHLSELVRGYMRQADYTTKTQAAAAQLKQAQDAQAAFTTARQALEQRLPAVLANLAPEFEQPVDWVKLAATDPIGYAQKDARFKAFQAARDEAQQLARLRQNEDLLRKQEMRRLGHEFLMQVLPGWRDPTTRAALQQAQIQHLHDVGYSQPEIDAYEMLDPRQVVILEESRRFRALVAAHPELLRTAEIRPTPPSRRGAMPQPIGGPGRLPAQETAGVPATVVSAERAWNEMGAHEGAAARDAAVELIRARREARNRASPATLRPTRGR